MLFSRKVLAIKWSGGMSLGSVFYIIWSIAHR